MRKLLPIILSLLLVACGTGHSGPVDEKKAEVVAVPVEVAKARIGSVVAVYSATATLEANGEARVVPRLGGQIVEILVEEGSQVRVGQVLARIDADRLRLELARAEADVSRLRQDFHRHLEMHQRSLISTEVFERMKYELKAQQAQFELAQLQLSWTEITAPIAGVVSERMVRVGNTVDSSQAVFVVTAMDRLQAIIHVPEREMAMLAAGQPVRLQVDALPAQRFEARVARISPVVDPASGTFRVTVELKDDSARLRPGMFGRFQVVHDQRDQAILVPVEAVLSEDGRQSLFVVDGDLVQRRAVVTGYRNNGDVEILQGIEAGEQVVVTGQSSLRSGTTVAILGQSPATADEPGEENEPTGESTLQLAESDSAQDLSA